MPAKRTPKTSKLTATAMAPCNRQTVFATGTLVPNSCIESAELIIQAKNRKTHAIRWVPNQTRTPHVWMEFADHIINISKTPGIHELQGLHALNDYPFGDTLPALGEGIGIIKKTPGNAKYNMHFGARVETSSGCMVSDVSETKSPPVVPLTLMTLESVNDFRTGGYESVDNFALAKLTVTPDKSKTELK